MALAVQWLLWGLIRPSVWFLFYPAVFVSSRIGGLRPGVASTLLSTALVWWFFVSPPQTLLKPPRELFPALVFTSMGIFFAVFHERLRQARQRLADALAASERAKEEVSRLYAKTRELDELKTSVSQRDLVARKRAEETLKQEEAHEEWASLIAHDLQQPVSTILLRSDLLLRAPLTEQQKKDVHHIRRAAGNMRRLVDDVLDASLLDSHRMRLELGRSEVGTLVREAVSRDPEVAQRVKLRAGEQPLFVRADAARIVQVLTNLVSNAVKYGTPGEDVVVDVTVKGSDAEVTVTTRGAGIPAGDLPTIFDRHVRTDSARRSGAGGSGLGLHIARGLVEAHGGRIWVTSVPGGATTFGFLLPLDFAQ